MVLYEVDTVQSLFESFFRKHCHLPQCSSNQPHKISKRLQKEMQTVLSPIFKYVVVIGIQSTPDTLSES